mmetsp:Transcript_9653/g.20387  ORF Transcript_9653/g.20387 Transcript_9653/m.20387 type:complete len:311 (-) Transcript_9653:797-1729(-)
MHAHDRIPFPQIATSPHQPIHPVLHLGIPPLHCIEIQRRVLARLHPARRCPTADPNAVARPSNLNHEHALLGFALRGVSSIHGPHACREHDWLDPLETLPGRQSHAETAGKAVYHRLAEFVTVIARSVGGFHLDLQRTSEVGRINELLVLPREGISRNVEVSDAVRADPGDGVRALSRGHDIAESSSGTGLGSGEGCHGRGEIVRFRRQDGVKRLFHHFHLARFGDAAGNKGVALVSANGAGVVVEGDDAVVGHSLGHCGFDHLEERVGFGLSVDDHFAPEVPVPTVFGVGLTHVKAFDIGGIAAQFLLE